VSAGSEKNKEILISEKKQYVNIDPLKEKRNIDQ
jgi:hypothetical protein